ncbi:cytochrome b/b6 domain-containing protein [Accumulibacter sp.]|uniref:cytochrome b/b6 domain-containing protein n=1 Tax=Accumulibacter sp. TaxID=2053492 RepID=UPI002637EFB6|nr:cytochrome b/b6 domain-containing protein [Accumulibacter sp.]
MTAARIRLWELPIRIFHWSLAAAVLSAIASGLTGGNWMIWHQRLGLVAVGRPAFRLVWGFAGPTHARFSSFWPTPGKVAAYLRGAWRGIGHNPLAALSVLALLGTVAFQASRGLLANDDIAFNGPFYALIDKATNDAATGWHRTAVNVLYLLVARQVAAIAFHARIKRQNLIRPMITGWHEGQGAQPTCGGSRHTLAFSLALALLVVYAASGTWLPAPVTPATSPTMDW